MEIEDIDLKQVIEDTTGQRFNKANFIITDLGIDVSTVIRLSSSAERRSKYEIKMLIKFI